MELKISAHLLITIGVFCFVRCNHPVPTPAPFGPPGSPKVFRFNQGSSNPKPGPQRPYQPPPPRQGGGSQPYYNYDRGYNNYPTTNAPTNSYTGSQWVEIRPKQSGRQSWQNDQRTQSGQSGQSGQAGQRSWQGQNSGGSRQGWQNNRQTNSFNRQSNRQNNDNNNKNWQAYDASAASSNSWQPMKDKSRSLDSSAQGRTTQVRTQGKSSGNNFSFSMSAQGRQEVKTRTEPNQIPTNSQFSNTQQISPQGNTQMMPSNDASFSNTNTQNNQQVSASNPGTQTQKEENQWYRKGNGNNRFNFSPWQKSRVNLVEKIQENITPSPTRKFPSKVQYLDGKEGKWVMVGQTLGTTVATTRGTTQRPTPKDSLISGWVQGLQQKEMSNDAGKMSMAGGAFVMVPPSTTAKPELEIGGVYTPSESPIPANQMAQQLPQQLQQIQLTIDQGATVQQKQEPPVQQKMKTGPQVLQKSDQGTAVEQTIQQVDRSDTKQKPQSSGLSVIQQLLGNQTLMSELKSVLPFLQQITGGNSQESSPTKQNKQKIRRTETVQSSRIQKPQVTTQKVKEVKQILTTTEPPRTTTQGRLTSEEKKIYQQLMSMNDVQVNRFMDMMAEQPTSGPLIGQLNNIISMAQKTLVDNPTTPQPDNTLAVQQEILRKLARPPVVTTTVRPVTTTEKSNNKQLLAAQIEEILRQTYKMGQESQKPFTKPTQEILRKPEQRQQKLSQNLGQMQKQLSVQPSPLQNQIRHTPQVSKSNTASTIAKTPTKIQSIKADILTSQGMMPSQPSKVMNKKVVIQPQKNINRPSTLQGKQNFPTYVNRQNALQGKQNSPTYINRQNALQGKQNLAPTQRNINVQNTVLDTQNFAQTQRNINVQNTVLDTQNFAQTQRNINVPNTIMSKQDIAPTQRKIKSPETPAFQAKGPPVSRIPKRNEPTGNKPPDWLFNNPQPVNKLANTQVSSKIFTKKPPIKQNSFSAAKSQQSRPTVTAIKQLVNFKQPPSSKVQVPKIENPTISLDSTFRKTNSQQRIPSVNRGPGYRIENVRDILKRVQTPPATEASIQEQAVKQINDLAQIQNQQNTVDLSSLLEKLKSKQNNLRNTFPEISLTVDQGSSLPSLPKLPTINFKPPTTPAPPPSSTTPLPMILTEPPLPVSSPSLWDSYFNFEFTTPFPGRKRGTCPVASTVMASCMKICARDGECTGRQKCCHSGNNIGCCSDPERQASPSEKKMLMRLMFGGGDAGTGRARGGGRGAGGAGGAGGGGGLGQGQGIWGGGGQGQGLWGGMGAQGELMGM